MRRAFMSLNEICREIERMEAEVGAELPELSDPTYAERAQRLLDCADPPRGLDADLCRDVLSGACERS